MAAESPRVERQTVDMDVPGSVKPRPRKVEAEAEAELLLSFAEARVQELELLCQNTSQRITSAKAAAQRWRQIAIRMLPALVPFHSCPGELQSPFVPRELMQLLAAQQLDETKLVTATLCQSFQVSERGLALRQECLALAKQEGLLEAQLEKQNNTCDLLQEDLAFAWTNHKERTERSAEFPEVKDVKLMELRELELVSGNLQLESADLLVSEQESIAEARSLEQDTWNLQKQISLLKRKAEQHYGRAEHLSSSLTSQHRKVSITRREIQEVRSICDSWVHPATGSICDSWVHPATGRACLNE